VHITESDKNGAVILALNGRLDAETSGNLAKRLAELVESKRYKIILDLSGLEYISSAGLRIILEITKKTRISGGNLYLVNIQEYVKKVLDISGLSTFLKICPTLGDAEKEIGLI
jgi:anti-sigma B factor antagonist